MSEYPHISKGLGLFTPNIWDRWMKMLRWFEENNINEHDFNTLHNRIHKLENRRDWFYAKLLRAHVIDEDLDNPNVYEYAWVRVTPKTGTPECCAECLDTRGAGPFCCDTNSCDDSVALQGYFQWEEDLSWTSWGTNTPGAWGTGDYDEYNPLSQPCVPGTDNDPCHLTPYTLPAMNIMELFNTSHHAAPGTDETKGIGDFMMQAVGGGDTVLEYSITDVCDDIPFEPCTQYEFPLWTTPVVMMWMHRETDGTLRYLFQAENAYDGTCAECGS
jgi:hypothetical protein